jgi:hypothetical protein
MAGTPAIASTTSAQLQETRGHLRVALAWGWVEPHHIAHPMALLDRQLAVLWKLTH